MEPDFGKLASQMSGRGMGNARRGVSWCHPPGRLSQPVLTTEPSAAERRGPSGCCRALIASAAEALGIPAAAKAARSLLLDPAILELRRSRAVTLLVPLFVLSGATSLVYETLWERQLHLVMGTSQISP